MDEDKTILFNYLLSLNDKTSEVLSDKNNQKDTLIDENTKKENKYNDDIYSLNFMDNTNHNLENDNRKKNETLLPLDNEISKDTKTTLLKDISYKDTNKRNFSSKNKLEPKNSIFKADNDYNKSFKNRMDIMQAVLDDELNISSDDNNFIRRRVKSRTTVKRKEKRLKNIKIENKDTDNIFHYKEGITENKDDNEMYKDNFKNNIKEKEEKREEIIFNNNYQKDDSNNKEEKIVNNKEYNKNLIHGIKLDNNKEKEQKVSIIKNNDEKKEDKEKRKVIDKLSNLMETLNKEDENYNISFIPNSKNKITEEIKFQIFNDKPVSKRKSSYIDIDFNDKEKDPKNKKKKDNYKMNSERMNNNEKSQFIYTNRNNNNNLNKFKTKYNKSYINIKEYKNNNNTINYKNKGNSVLPISNKFYNLISNNKNNNNNNYIIKKDEKNKNNSKNIFPESLDNLINKIKNSCEKKINNNSFRAVKNVSINKKIKDIKDSLQKINDINKENENLLKESSNQFSTNKKIISFNNICSSLNDDSYQSKLNTISRNIFFSKRTDSSDYIFQDKTKTINPSKNLTNTKTNSYSNLLTINNNSPIRSTFRNKKIFTINNININNLQLMNKNLKIKNIVEDLGSNTLLNNINISDRTNSQGIKDDKNITNNNFANINSQVRLYYTSEKKGNTKNTYNDLHKTKSSKFKSYINKISANNLLKDYSIINDYSKGKKDEFNSDFKINYKNEKNKINNIHLFSSSRNSNNKDIQYIYNNSYKDSKHNIRKKNKIKRIHNYWNKTKDTYIKYNNHNFKDMFSPFEKIKRKKVHSIFPVNPFDEINYIKERNFLIN